MANFTDRRHRAPETPGEGSRDRHAIYAALDLGTNNCRLLIARPTAEGFRVIDAFSRIVRLGEGISATGRLSEAAMTRTLSALRVCAGKMRRRGVSHARAVATEACRQADNGGAFLERVRRETGVVLEIISHGEEADLGLRGCLPLLDGTPRHALVFDIGGGSTEISWLDVPAANGRHARAHGHAAHNGAALASLSVPVGVVTLAERYGGREVSAETYRAMVAEMCDLLADFEAEHGLGALVADGGLQMLGISGTVTTLTGVYKKLPRYNRALVDGFRLDFAAIAEVTARIVSMSYEERVAQPCIGKDRADLVIGGCALLDAICRTWPVGHLRVADRGLREGILIKLIGHPEGGAAPAARADRLG